MIRRSSAAMQRVERATRRRARAVAIALTSLAVLAGGESAASAAPSGASQAQVDDARKREAQARYERGVQAYSAGRYREAVDRFLEADAVLPSAPLSYNIALAYENLSDTAGALRFYRDYLRRAPNSENAEEVQRRVRELEQQLATRGVQQMTVRSDPAGATVFVDDRPVGVTPWTGELAPGSYRLALALPNHPPAERRVRLMPTRSLDVNLVLATGSRPVIVTDAPANEAATEPTPPRVAAASERGAASPSEKSFGPWPWITLGAGGVALASAGVFELLRQGAEDDARKEQSQIGFAERVDSMESHQLTARILAGVGGVLVITGGALLLFAPEREAAPKSQAAVACLPNSCYGVVRTSF